MYNAHGNLTEENRRYRHTIFVFDSYFLNEN